MFWVILFLAIVLSLLTAYTMAIQGTTLAIGRLLAHKFSSNHGTGLQDALTPKSQTIRNITVIFLFIVLFGLITYAYAWYHALWVLAITFLSSTVFPIILGIRPGSSRLVSRIISNMKRRHQNYLKSGDTLRADVINELINRIEQLPIEEIRQETKH